MTEEMQDVQETTTRVGNTVQRNTEVRKSEPRGVHDQRVAERLIWFVVGALMVLLGFRFILSLLGANTTNGFASFIYSVSHPFVAPFFSLFNYNNIAYGTSRFELFTLIAMAVYTVIGWGIARLVTLNQD